MSVDKVTKKGFISRTQIGIQGKAVCDVVNLQQKRVLLRADAHKFVGTGDLVSFMALARWMSPRGWDCHFAVRATQECLALLNSYGIAADHIHSFADDLPVDSEVQLTAALAVQLRVDVVLVQVTDRPLAAYAEMNFRGRPVLKGCVSFENTTPQGFDIVWSWDVTVSGRYNTDTQPTTHWFLGPEYVVLPPEFDLQCTQQRVLRSPREHMLVAMGGGDAEDLTSAVARKLNFLKNTIHTTFVLGSGYIHEESLRHSLLPASYPWDIKNSVTDMFAEYMACDICIGAGGLTASELVFTRTPALLIAACGHQDSRCALFAQRGWAKYLGTAQDWQLTLDDVRYFTPSTTQYFVHKLHEVLETLDVLTIGKLL